MYCKHCGKEIPENSEFCTFCGKAVNISKLKAESDNISNLKEKQHQDENQNQTNFIGNYFNVIKKYVDFHGRASRKEFWMFILANIVISLGLGLLEVFIGAFSKSEVSIFTTIYSLFIFIPNLALGVRRMHDADKSGWVLIIPIFNFIVSLRKGNPKTNKYGPSPTY